MAALPAEPIVCLDDLTPEAAEIPLEASEACIIECYAREDPVVRFLAKPGREVAFMSALVNCYRQSHSHAIHEVGNFSCTAWVLDTADEGCCPQSMPSLCQGVHDLEAVAGLVESEGVNYLTQLGMNSYEADMLLNTRPEALKPLKALLDELPRRMQAYIQEHGPVYYLHFFGCCPPAVEKGRAQEMLAHLAAISHNNSRPIYTEASGEERKGMLVAAGYEEVGSYEVAERGPCISILVRRPGSKGVQQPATPKLA